MTNKPRSSASRSAQLGLSMVELLVAVTLGLMLMAGLATLFANNSAARIELERNSRQIENGRFAMELLTDDLRMAGFYGELALDVTYPAVMPDPCSTDPIAWRDALTVAVQHYDNAVGVPGCLGISPKAGTDVIVIRRASTCEAGVGSCPNLVSGVPYIQIAKCKTMSSAARNMPNSRYVLEKQGTGVFDRTNKDCSTRAGARQYMVRVYFIGEDTVNGVVTPSLKRADFNGVDFATTSLVEGIEELNVEYGIDNYGTATDAAFLEGSPDVYSADPANYAKAGCANYCTSVHNMGNIVTAHISLLARNLEATPHYNDTKTYHLGYTSGNLEQTVTPNGPYRRHVYSGVVRIVNVSQRRERVPAGA